MECNWNWDLLRLFNAMKIDPQRQPLMMMLLLSNFEIIRIFALQYFIVARSLFNIFLPKWLPMQILKRGKRGKTL